MSSRFLSYLGVFPLLFAVASCGGDNDGARAPINERECEASGGVLTSEGLCQLCGNGVVEPGEECDDGGETSSCTASCTLLAGGTTDPTNPASAPPVETCDAAACDDGLACTIDTCDLVAGCLHTTDTAICDDHDVCTEDVCNQTGACVYAASTGVCRSLAFGVSPPQEHKANSKWAAFTVLITGASGAQLAGANSMVELRVLSGSGQLTGKLAVRAKDGLATFDDVTYSVAEDLTLEVSSGAMEPLTVNLTSNLCMNEEAELAELQAALDAEYEANCTTAGISPISPRRTTMASLVTAIATSWSCNPADGIYYIDEQAVTNAVVEVFRAQQYIVEKIYKLFSPLPKTDADFNTLQTNLTLICPHYLSRSKKDLFQGMLLYCGVMPNGTSVTSPELAAASTLFLTKGVQRLADLDIPPIFWD